MKKIVIDSISAFYKNDKDDGFGLTFTKDMMDLSVLHDSIRGQAQIYAKLITQKQYGKQELNQLLLNQLTTEIIPTLWKNMYGTDSNPPIGTNSTVDIGNMPRDAKEAMVLFFTSVSWLAQQHVIPDDNFSGMMYSYTE